MGEIVGMGGQPLVSGKEHTRELSPQEKVAMGLSPDTKAYGRPMSDEEQCQQAAAQHRAAVKKQVDRNTAQALLEQKQPVHSQMLNGAFTMGMTLRELACIEILKATLATTWGGRVFNTDDNGAVESVNMETSARLFASVEALGTNFAEYIVAQEPPFKKPTFDDSGNVTKGNGDGRKGKKK